MKELGVFSIIDLFQSIAVVGERKKNLFLYTLRLNDGGLWIKLTKDRLMEENVYTYRGLKEKEEKTQRGS